MLLVLGASPVNAQTVTFTPISVDSSVHASINGTLGPYDETDSSTALEPSIQLSHSEASGNIAVSTFVIANNNDGASLPYVLVSTGYLTKASGPDNDSDISYSYELTFTLAEAALVSLVNSSGPLPRASASIGSPSSASLNYTLRQQGGSSLFTYDAPETNSAGTYAEAVASAGTYEFIVTGAASSPGDVCCPSHSATAIGDARLEFLDAPPPPPLPLLGPLALSAMTLAVGLVGAVASRRGQS